MSEAIEKKGNIEAIPKVSKIETKKISNDSLIKEIFSDLCIIFKIFLNVNIIFLI